MIEACRADYCRAKLDHDHNHGVGMISLRNYRRYRVLVGYLMNFIFGLSGWGQVRARPTRFQFEE